jgi:hypothetical protein
MSMRPLALTIDLIPPALLTQGSTQPLVEMSSSDLPWWGGGHADNPIAICVPIVLHLSVGASTSHNPMRRHGLLQ